MSNDTVMIRLQKGTYSRDFIWRVLTSLTTLSPVPSLTHTAESPTAHRQLRQTQPIVVTGTTATGIRSWKGICNTRADFWLAPSQWETSLQSNTVSHWLGANLQSALQHGPVITPLRIYCLQNTLERHFHFIYLPWSRNAFCEFKARSIFHMRPYCNCEISCYDMQYRMCYNATGLWYSIP